MNCGTNNKGHCGPDKGCGCFHKARHFFTEEERIQMLENYREQLEKELRGLDQKLQEMQKTD